MKEQSRGGNLDGKTLPTNSKQNRVENMEGSLQGATATDLKRGHTLTEPKVVDYGYPMAGM